MINASLKNAKILIVDDQQANIDVLEGLLEAHGYSNIKSTTDPRDVADLLSSFQPDLILLDLSMPYMSGYEVMEQIKRIISPTTYLPILVLTADITHEARERALSNGAKDFLVKPFDLIEVSLRINNLLETRYLYQQQEYQNHILEEKVKERTAELLRLNKDLIVAKDKAESSDHLKTAFIKNISHEIRTPLNGILGLCDLIIEPNLSNEDKKEYIPLIHDSSNRLLNTITEYLDISLIMSNNIEVNHSLINVHEILTGIRSQYTDVCMAKGIPLIVHLAENEKEYNIYSDFKLLNNIFKHLVENAIKFTSKGEIEIGYSFGDEVIEFYVKDSGIGIDSNKLNIIYNLFMQEDISDARRYEGSGLGLAIVKGFLNIMGGNIYVESDKDKGSLFVFQLPLNNEQQDKSKLHRENAEHNKIPTILIAEDDSTNYIYFESSLKKHTEKIYRATNGKEAVELCRAHPEISLVLMDIKMPILNGVEATKEIKRFRNNLPVIAITAYAMGEDEKVAKDAGCDGFIAKPAMQKEILRHIKNLGFNK